jgi:predicted DNA-binding transcriptional regulator YafY
MADVEARASQDRSMKAADLLPDRARHFMEALNQIESPFTARTYAERFSITSRTAQKDLEILIEKGLVSREGQGRNTRYRFR